MKKATILLLLMCFALISNAQCISKEYKGYKYCIQADDTVSSTKVKFSSIPMFRGNINKWFSDSTNYPDTALYANIQGSVFLNFIVEKDGSVSKLKVCHGLYKELNREALRIAPKMPKWKPGMVNGHKAQCEMLLHVCFKISDAPIIEVHTAPTTSMDSVAIKQ